MYLFDRHSHHETGPTMTTIAIANRKGGVGKTTLAVNLAAALGRFGHAVLVIDMDAQRGNATRSFRLDEIDPALSLGSVLADGKPIDEIIVETKIRNVWAAPAHPDMTSLAAHLANEIAPDMRLRSALSKMRLDFDFIIIDCGPSLDVLTINGLVAADYVIAPHAPEPLSWDGIIDLITTIDDIRRFLRDDLYLGAIVINRPNPLPTRVGRDIMQRTREMIADREPPIRIAETVIPQNVRIQEAQDQGVSVFEVDPDCPSAQAFMSLAKEVLAWQTNATSHRGRAQATS